MTDISSTPERRQAPRVPPVTDCECRIPLRLRVRLLDISLEGALLAGDTQLPKGSTTRVRMPLGYRAFDADGEVRRIAEPQMNAAAATAVGISFMSMDEQSRRSLEEFVRRARS
jgi:c-di-GMP-binding flagellar brake protein YcgR